MQPKHTNELLDIDQLNKILEKLHKTIPNFPDLDGRTYSYDYDSEEDIISFTWEGGYYISEDHGNYVFDFNERGEMIGIEILSLKKLLRE